jgi:ADP-ribose pyrophosphatase YjhB (NUDIX family)
MFRYYNRMNDKKYVIRCRAVILNEGKMLVVSHPHDTSFYALPGGHLEWGEGAHECLKREIVEELGIEPRIGRLLYVNTFMDGEKTQPFEFFFEVLNGEEYLDISKNDRTHQHEISHIHWITQEDGVKVLPKQLEADFRSGNVLSDTPRFIQG